MPNHVTTIIDAAPHVLEAMTRTLTREEQKAAHDAEREFFTRMDEKKLEDFEESQIIDFELLVPSPPNKETGGCNGKHEDGEVCWYSWNVDNWGTKWGAYSSEIEENSLTFQTAWSHPWPIIKALHEKFPDERIEVRYADEDLGSNLGHYVIEDGETTSIIDDTSDEDVKNEHAAQILYGQSYAELRSEWDADEIHDARMVEFCLRIEKERGLVPGQGYTVVREESLSVPQDIIDSIQTIEDVHKLEAAML